MGITIVAIGGIQIMWRTPICLIDPETLIDTAPGCTCENCLRSLKAPLYETIAPEACWTHWSAIGLQKSDVVIPKNPNVFPQVIKSIGYVWSAQKPIRLLQNNFPKCSIFILVGEALGKR